MDNLQAGPPPNPPDATPTLVDVLPQVLNPGTPSSPTLDACKKRTRDHIHMTEIQYPENTNPEMTEHTEQENVTKIPKLDGAQEETSDKDAEGGGEAIRVSHPPKLKRKKIALLVAYCGLGYQGMQRNPGAKTIEGDLEEALFKAGAIFPEYYGNPRMQDWMRSARTDKGVSAVGQVVSGRFVVDPPGFVERVNSHLPHQIRVLGYKRVTSSFNAKRFCDRRRYEYVLPVFALDSSIHRDRETVLASEGKEGVALVKCVECSERGRKVVGVMGRRNEFEKGGVNGLDNSGELGMEADNTGLNEVPLENQDLMVAKNESTDDFEGKCVGSLGGLVAETDNRLGNNDEFNMEADNAALKETPLENHDLVVAKNDNADDFKGKCVGSLGGLVAETVNGFEMTEKSSIMEDHDRVVVYVNNEKTLDNQDSVVGYGLKGEGLEKQGKNENSSEMKSSEEMHGDKIRLLAEAGDVGHGAKSLDEGSEQTVPMEGCEIEKVPVEQKDEIAAKSTFKYGEEERNRLNRILRKYVGTHNFHNLTTRTKAEDPSANRYILQFEASDVFNIDGMDFVRCTVVGQSFMLHQIRKMMGLAVAVMRGCAPESIIDTALRKDVHMNVPTAPELGLFLDECFFPAYNQKWQATHEEVSLKGFEQQILELKRKYVYEHIASTEVKDGVVALWLHSLNQRNYPDLVVGGETEKLQNGTEFTIPIPQESTADKDMLAN